MFEPEDLMELRNIPKVEFPHRAYYLNILDIIILDNNILDNNILDINIPLTQDENSKNVFAPRLQNAWLSSPSLRLRTRRA